MTQYMYSSYSWPLFLKLSKILVNTMEDSTTSGEHVVAPLYDRRYWNGEYFVVLKTHITKGRVEAHKQWILSEIRRQDERENYYLKFSKFDPLMYTGKFSEDILDQIRRSADVEYVAKNGTLKLC